MGLLKTNGAAKYRTVALIRFGRGAGQQTMKQQNYWLKVNENCITENRFFKLWACWVLGMHQSEVTIPFPCSAAIIRINNTQNGATNTRPLSTNASPLSTNTSPHSIIAGASRKRIWTGRKKKLAGLLASGIILQERDIGAFCIFFWYQTSKNICIKSIYIVPNKKKVSTFLLHKQRKGERGGQLQHIMGFGSFMLTWWDELMGLICYDY